MGRLAPGLGRVSGSPGPLHGHTSGCVWCGKCLVVVSRDDKRLEMRVLTVLTRDRLFVPGTNPLRGPRSSFVDGGCSGNLPLGQRIGDEEV